VLDQRIDARIDAALTAFKPQVIQGLKDALQEAAMNPGPPAGVASPESGVVPGSPVTPSGAALLQTIFQSNQPSDMEKMASFISQARMVSDALNPPSIWDRVMQNVVIRSLSRQGLLTEKEGLELEKGIAENKP